MYVLVEYVFISACDGTYVDVRVQYMAVISSLYGVGPREHTQVIKLDSRTISLFSVYFIFYSCNANCYPMAKKLFSF